MPEKKIEEIKDLLRQSGKVYVNELSERFGVSEVSVRKYLARLEREGFAERFYGGAELSEQRRSSLGDESIYSNPQLISLAEQACSQVADGDSIFIGSGRTCSVLARRLTGFKNLTVVTNNITAIPDLLQNAARLYMIGGEVTNTDKQTWFSSWESPQSLLKNIFVNKAFTSAAGIDLKAGITVDSVISTYILRLIPEMSHRWYLMIDAAKYDKISIYPVAELGKIQTLITNSIPAEYAARCRELDITTIMV